MKNATRLKRAQSGVAAICMFAVAGCGGLPGPSVPYQSGKNLDAARVAVRACAPVAPRGGRNAVTGGYVAGVILGGLVLGPIVVASNQSTIRANGEARAVDKCLAEKGYVRRDLTAEEVRALNSLDRYGRERLLDHLIGGGSIESFGLS